MGWSRQEVLDVARSTGETVVEAWSKHDAGSMGTVVGPMLHHTGSAWSWPRLTAPTLKTVREGRPDLPNSLCMYYIDYAGTIYCISEKLSWHAGGGEWSGITDGNGHYAGIEAESDGTRWTDATLRSYKKLAAAILRKTGRNTAYAPRHADYALPKGRKSDFSGYDSKAFIKDVAQLLANPNAEDDMTPEQATQLAEVHWMLEQIKPQTDRLTAVQAATDQLTWGVLDEQQGLRVMVAGLLGKEASGVTAADIAALIPDGIAKDVADELAKRMAA